MTPPRPDPIDGAWPEPIADRVGVLRRRVAEQAGELADLRARWQALAERAAALEQARDASHQRAASLRERLGPATERLTRGLADLAAAERANAEAAAQVADLRVRTRLVMSSAVWRASWPLRAIGRALPSWLRGARRTLPGVGTPAVSPVLPASAVFRAADPGWTEPGTRDSFTALAELRPDRRVAVVAHIFYPDLWPELADAIDRLDEPFDLFVTLVRGAADALAPTVRDRWPFAHVIVVDNHGRDILPFLELLRTGVLLRYELICKLHTKRSLWHEDGEAWRRDLIGGVLGSPEVARGVPAAFRADPTLGLVVADAHLYSGRVLWLGNERHLTRLFKPFGITRAAFDRSFAGGSMFWLRAGALRGLAELDLRFDDFECEPLPADGSMAHAVERLVSLLCYREGMTVRRTGDVLAHVSQTTETI
jgi:hypothetical protein